MSIQKRNNSPAGNTCDKYHSKNPLYKYLVASFLASLKALLKGLPDAKSLLDVGCGEGYVMNHIEETKLFKRLEGVDVSEEIIEKARSLYPHLNLKAASAHSLPYSEKKFDVICMCEVLEHLEDYEKAIHEAKRVARKYVIISVPVEPMWRIFNIMRGKYIFSGGNTPGHVQHWGKREFKKLLEKHFSVKTILYPLPWQIALCEL